MPFKKYQRYAVAIVPVILLGFIFFYFSDILTYIFLAWIISMVGAPINNRLRSLIGSVGASLVTLITFAVLGFIILYAFIPPIVQQTRKLANIDYERMIQSLEDPIDDWNKWLIKRGILLEETSSDKDTVAEDAPSMEIPYVKVFQLDSILRDRDSLHTSINIVVNLPSNNTQNPIDQNTESISGGDSFFDQLRNNLIHILDPSKISMIFSSLVGALGNIIITFFSVFFIAFFFLKEQGLFTRIVQSLVPNNNEAQWTHALDESAHLLMRYFTGVLIQITLITIGVSLALKFMGFENALLIGFFAALMNVIPYVGPILGASFGMLITLSSNLDAQFYSELLPMLGWIALVFGIMQLIDNFILQPNIFSKSVKAHPLEIFIIVLVGAKIGGILGMVVAIPVYTIIRVLAKVFFSEFKVVKKITKSL